MIKNTLIHSKDVMTLNNYIEKSVGKFSSHSKTILFIEPYGSTLSLIKRGVQNGYNIIILTANTELRIVPYAIIAMAHLAIQVDTIHEETVVSLAKQIQQKIKIDAVIPGFEYFVPIASKVSDNLGLPGIAIEKVMNLRNKAIMRQRLERAKLSIPKYQIVTSFEDLTKAMETIGFPAVCKPIDAAGSVYVKKVNNAEEAYQAAASILQRKNMLWGYELSNTLLYEEYIEGKEYSVEGIITNGIIKYCSVTEKQVADESEFIEIGHIVNPPIGMTLKKRIEKYVEYVVHALQPNHCPFHAEIRINNDGLPVLMEIAARLPGDKIGELITLSSGINFFDDVYYAYLGDTYSANSHRMIQQNNVAGIRFFYRPEIEKFTHVTSMVDAKEYQVEDVCFYYQANECIPAFPKPLRRLGHVMMKGNNYADIVKRLKAVDDGVIFHS